MKLIANYAASLKCRDNPASMPLPAGEVRLDISVSVIINKIPRALHLIHNQSEIAPKPEI